MTFISASFDSIFFQETTRIFLWITMWKWGIICNKVRYFGLCKIPCKTFSAIYLSNNIFYDKKIMLTE